ncbi:MAG: glycosyltransferase [Candidatus Contendobacter sp.]|jgi:glycosyltransferase involved in cell wall biosynthesis|nr:glycosyltransferase [Candidatus Contendobacter sp.]
MINPHRPRVLFVLPAITMGGAEIRLLNMLDQFERIEPALLTHRVLLEYCPSNILALPFEGYPDCVNPYPFDWKNACAYARAIAETGNRWGAALVFGWMHNGSIFTALAGTLFGLKSRLAGSVLGPISEHYRFQGLSPTWYERVLLTFTFRRLQGLVVPSDGTRQDLIDYCYAPARYVQRIYNGVDLAKVRDLAQWALPKLPSDAPVVLAASRLSLEKGFDVQLRAFARVRQVTNARFFILGEGPLRLRIEGWITELGLSNDVKLLGFQRNPFAWMRLASVFLMASRLEGFGNALVEAMSLGLPVVSTACPYGPREIVEQGHSGLLSPVDDDAALADNLLRVLQNAEYATRLGEGARLRAKAFTMTAMIEGYERFVLTCLKNIIIS